MKILSCQYFCCAPLLVGAALLVLAPTWAGAQPKPRKGPYIDPNPTMIFKIPGYRPSAKQRIKKILRPLTFPRTRHAIRKQGGLKKMILRGITNNRLVQWPARVSARRQARLEQSVLARLNQARSPAEQQRFRVARVIKLTREKGNTFNAHVVFRSKRSGGYSDRNIRVSLDPGRLGALGRLLGHQPGISIPGRDRTGALTPLAPLVPGETMIVGSRTMMFEHALRQ